MKWRLQSKNPTAEAAFEALKQLPDEELARLSAMLATKTPTVDESTEWSDEDLQDFSNAGARLIEKSFGPEDVDYD